MFHIIGDSINSYHIHNDDLHVIISGCLLVVHWEVTTDIIK